MKAFKDLNPGDIIYYYDHCKMKPLEVVTCKIEETENRIDTWRGYEVRKDKDLIIITKTAKPIKIYCSYHNGDVTNTYGKYSKIFSCKEAAEKEEGKVQSEFYHFSVVPAMAALRKPVDELEMIVDKEVWPMPSYGDLLFEV